MSVISVMLELIWKGETCSGKVSFLRGDRIYLVNQLDTTVLH